MIAPLKRADPNQTRPSHSADPHKVRALAYALALVRTYLGPSARKVQWRSADDVIRWADSIAVLLGTMPERK